MSTKRVMITGAAGFIGSNLHERCLQEGWSVFAVDNFSNGHYEFVPKNAFCLTSDFADSVVLDIIRNQQFDIVFHLAAIPRVGYSVKYPLVTNVENVSKTLTLMEACRGNVNRFVFASSSSVYGGDVKLPTQEGAAKDPKSPYALQKLIIENYLTLYSDLYGFDSIALRFFNVFGPKQLGDSPYACAIAAWLTAIHKDLPMRSDGDGTQSRDLCYVDNVTDCCVRAANYKRPLNLWGGIPINVACGDRTTNNDILNYLKERFSHATSYDNIWRPGDVMHTHANIERANIMLGYKPLVKVWEGIDRTIKWYEENRSFAITRKLTV